MVLGSCVVYTPETGRKQLSPIQVSVTGTMRGLIAAFTITQEFRHRESFPADVSYIIPTNNKLCLYETVFYVGDEVIKTQLEQKNVGAETFFEAKAAGRTVILGTSLADGIIEFRIANVANTVAVRVEVKACLWCSVTGPDSLLVKLPMDVCTPDGSLQSLTSQFSGSFSLAFDYKSRKSLVSDVKLNVDGDIDTVQAEIKSTRMPKTAFEIVMKHRDLIMDECLACGRLMALSLCGRQVLGSLENDEFVFIIDNSKFLNHKKWGNDIQEAVERALPQLPARSFANVCTSSASKQGRNKDKCVPVGREVEERASSVLATVQSPCSGDSQLYDALEHFFKQPLVGKCRCRQIFVLTPGQVRDVTKLLDLCEDHSSRNRIWTLVVGDNPNHGFVEGMSDLTGGQCVYVEKPDDLAAELVTALDTSLACSICDVTIDVDGHDNIEMSRFPIRPIAVKSLNNYLLKSGSAFENEQGVLVRGHCGNEVVDIPLTCELARDNAADVVSFHRLFGALFAHQRIQMLEHRIRAMKPSQEKSIFVQQAVALSKESGVLSDHTSFVGAAQARYKCRRSLLDNDDNERSCRPQNDLFDAFGMSGMGFALGMGPRMSGGVVSNRQVTLGKILAQQSRETGAWNYDGIVGIVTRFRRDVPNIPVSDQLSGLNKDQIQAIKATILAIAFLHMYYERHRKSYCIAERRSLAYLASVSKSVDWESAIQALFR